MTLGQKIKKLRNDKGLTQKDLSDELHVTFQTVSKWESGTNEPDIATIKELAKFFGCSFDYLLSDDEEEDGTQEVVTEPVVVPKEVVNKTVVIHQNEPHVCAKCGRNIPEEELVSEDVTKRERHGRFTRSVTVGQTYYHKSCLEEVKAERVEKEKRRKAQYAKKAKKLSFFWGIFGGSIALIATLLGLLLGAKSLNPGISVLLSILAGYGIFSMLYCIISGSYISEVFVWCAGLSIKFPGLIFSWDLEGFAWLIAMKILFAVLGFLVGVFALMFAIAFSATLGMISFPFVLIHNERTDYEDSLI